MNNTVKIILADDDDSDQELFHQALLKTKIEAELTMLDTGQQLMDYLKNNVPPNPDIIFLDINMPGKDGKKCLYEIKSSSTYKDIPVVMYTTSDDKQDIEDTFRTGANLYVPKPTSFQMLVQLLKKVVELNNTHILMTPVRERFVLSERTGL